MKAETLLNFAGKILFSLILLAVTFLASGQAVGDYRTNATGTWSWNTAANWQRCETAGTWAGASNTTYPGQNPGAGVVNIRDNTTVNVTADVPNTIGSLSINGGSDDSYVTFTGSFSLAVSGETYLYSNSNNDQKAVLVDAGIFSTGSVVATSTNNNSRDAYIRISTGSVTVAGDVTLNSNSQRTYILFTGAGSLFVGGSITGGNITSTVNGGNAAPTSGTVVFNGTSAQTLGDYTYFNLEIDNASGTSLPSDINVDNDLTMTQGNINTGSYLISVDDNLNYTSGTVIGRLQRNLTLTSTEYLYPVGTASSYNPLKITFANLSAGTLTIQFQASDPGTAGLPVTDGGVLIDDRCTTGFWRMTAGTLASTNYSVNLNYTGFSDVNTLSRILKRTNGGNFIADGTHGTVADPEITRTGMSGISTTTTDLAIGRSTSVFVSHPSDFTGCNATFSVVASGVEPLSYRWQEDDGGGFADLADGGLYSGTGTADLVITGATISMNGYLYRCVVTDGNSNTYTSNSATLTVTLPDVSLGYAYSMDVTLDQASGTEDLTDFPALVSFTSVLLRSEANGGHVNSASGYDVVFTDLSGNRLDHQLEYYDPTTGQYVAWVRIPLLSSSAQTTIRMWYGNQAVSTDPSLTSVWTSSYKGVWHLNGTGFTDDATSNLNNGVNNNTTSVTGKIAGGRGFNGSDSYIMTPANGFVANDNNQTISIWANYASTPTLNRNLMSFQNASQSSAIQLGFRGGNAVAWKWGGTILADGGPAPSTNTWHYYVYVYDGTTSYIYIDGVLMGSSGVAPQTYAPTEGDIGRYNDGEYLAANLDEPRFSMSPKSAGWIMTEYLNQNDPASFISLGSETSNTILATTGVCLSSYTLDQGYPAGGIYSGTGVSGTNFDPSSAGVGTHLITYTWTDGLGCSNSVSRDIIVTPVPDPPVAPGTGCCITNIADLTATGNNLRWYSDAALTVLEGTGTPFASGETSAGVYTYYVTQTVNGCQSSATTTTLNIFDELTITGDPVASSACLGGNASFSVIVAGYNPVYQWQENGSDLSDGGVYSGVNTSTLTLINPGSGLDGRTYRCVVTTTCGTSPQTSGDAILTIINTNLWTGAVDNDWNNTANWSCGIVPVQIHEVTIPDVVNKPVLSSGSAATVDDLTIESGSSLTISGNTIRISGNVSSNGSFDATAGTIEMNGSSLQQIPANLFTGNNIRDLIVNNSSGVQLLGQLDVTGYVMLSSGDLASDGYLTLVSDATSTACIDGSGSGAVTGIMTMQRYLPSGFGYRYISSPFTASTVNVLSDEINLGSSFPPVYKYDESRIYSGWVSYVNTDSLLRPVHGYSVNFGSSPLPVTVDFTGTAASGAFTRTLYNHNNTYTKGFNLIGNPYPSAIDWDAASGWTKTNIDNAIYFFKPGTTDQYGGTYSSYVNGFPSDGTVNNIIPSMQGFFVHVTDGAFPVTATLSMNNSVRSGDTSHPFAKSAEKGAGSAIRLSAHFTADTSAKDYLLIYGDVKATENFDIDLDALKLMNTDLKVPNLYVASDDSRKLSIAGLPAYSGSQLRIPLGLKANTAGTVVFSMQSVSGSFSGYPVFIYDQTEGISRSLLDNGNYSVFLTAGEYQNRFFLDINNFTTGTNEEKETITEPFHAWVAGDVVMMDVNRVNGNSAIIKITSLTGQTLFEKRVHEAGHYEMHPLISGGVYLISYLSQHERAVQKIILNR
ncbi:MAG TPA: DUF2341 domain-containing protein [Bacteroidales bacterium]|nr:DUF2341 domain-containing protein [Bacteroidales bacterium]